MRSLSNHHIAAKIFGIVVACVVLVGLILQNLRLGAQLERVIQETDRIQELAQQIQGLEPETSEIFEPAQPMREDLIPYTARIGGLKASAVTRIRPEPIRKNTLGISTRNTRVYLERVEIANLFKMLIAIEEHDLHAVITDLTTEYSDASRLWKAEFVITRPVFEQDHSD
jgi:hypothetical protein